MITKRAQFIATIAAAMTSLSAVADEDFEDAVRKCASIQDESARLTCFDAVAIIRAGSLGEPAVAPEPPAAATETVSTEPAPQAPAGLTLAEESADIELATGAAAAAAVAAEAQDEPPPLTDDVGIERVEPSKKENPEYSARVVRCDKHSQSGQIYFFLDNDQVWKQSNYRRISLGDCQFDVLMKKDAFGFQLYIPSKKRTVRVARIR